jgi:hypothetical protein
MFLGKATKSWEHVILCLIVLRILYDIPAKIPVLHWGFLLKCYTEGRNCLLLISHIINESFRMPPTTFT